MAFPALNAYPSAATFPGYAAGAPDALFVEIEFLTDVWTDVSTYVVWTSGGSTGFGRSSPDGAPQPGSFECVLDNTDGRFSPNRQTLVDGTAHPYWPNVKPRRRVRYGYSVGGVRFIRFTGYIKGWPQRLDGGWKPRVPVVAETRDVRLGRVTMLAPLRQVVSQDSPTLYWPLDDESDATAADEAVTGIDRYALTPYSPWLLGSPTFAADGVGGQNGHSVQFTGKPILANLALRGPLVGSGHAWSFEMWVKGSGTVLSEDIASIQVTGTDDTLTVPFFGQRMYGMPDIAYTDIRNGRWRHVCLTVSAANAAKVYVDGTLVDSGTWPIDGRVTGVFLGSNYGAWIDPDTWIGGPRQFTGYIAHVALYSTALSAARIATHSKAGSSFSGETVDARIARFLSYGGITSTGWRLDKSTVVCGTYPQEGQSVFAAAQDLMDTEGGGSVVYVAPDGKVRFTNRNYRKAVAPKLTVDADDDLGGDVFEPDFSDEQVVNQVQGQRATATGTASIQVVDDLASQDAVGLVSQSFTSYARSSVDVRANAEQRLASRREPGYRISQVAVDLSTAVTDGITTSVASVEIGDRIRVTNLYAAAAPASTVDLIVEGWSDQFSNEKYIVTFDTSPADQPAMGIFDNAVYGRFAADGNTLNATITSSATTLAIATATSKATFTTSGAAYPLTVRIDTEEIRLNTAPSGSTSPQTFTGITRGLNGTGAAAHTAAASVALVPTATFTL